MSTDVKRSRRVAERMREEVSLNLRTLSDPRLAGVVVTRVEVTDDLSFVRVWVRRELGAGPSEQKSLLRGFEAALGRIRRDVSKAVGLRVAPQFRFHYDDGIDHQERIEALLHEINTEPKES